MGIINVWYGTVLLSSYVNKWSRFYKWLCFESYLWDSVDISIANHEFMMVSFHNRATYILSLSWISHWCTSISVLKMFIFIYLQASFVLFQVVFKTPYGSSVSKNGLSSCAKESVSAVCRIGNQHDGSLVLDNEVEGLIVTGQVPFAIIGYANFNVNVFIELNAQVTFLNNFACWWFIISTISFLNLVPKHSLTMSYFIIFFLSCLVYIMFFFFWFICSVWL